MPWKEFESAKAGIHLILDPNEYTSWSLDERVDAQGPHCWTIVGTRKDGSEHIIIPAPELLTDRAEMKRLFKEFIKTIM